MDEHQNNKKGLGMATMLLICSLTSRDGGEVFDIEDTVYEVRRDGKRVICRAETLRDALIGACSILISAGEPLSTVVIYRLAFRPESIWLRGSLAIMARLFGLESVWANSANDNDPADEESEAA